MTRGADGDPVTAADHDPAAPKQPTRSRGSSFGLLGMGIWLIGVIVGFVVVVEHDPAGADYLDAAVRVHAIVERVTDTSIDVTSDEVATSLTVATEARDVGRFEPGDPVTVWHIDGNDVRLDEDAPLSPRRTSAFIAPAVLLLIGALVISAGPEILYPSKPSGG